MVTTKKETRFNDDIIDDVLRRVIEMAPGFSAALVAQIAQATRHEWAGEKIRIFYIARHDDGVRSLRNEAILRDHQKGERLGLLERRYKLSKRHILRVLKQGGR